MICPGAPFHASLAGRMGIVRLHPLSQAELARRKPHFLDRIFGAEFKTKTYERLGAGLVDRYGYPTRFQGSPETEEAAGKRFASGVVLYDGETSVGFGAGVFFVGTATKEQQTTRFSSINSRGKCLHSLAATKELTSRESTIPAYAARQVQDRIDQLHDLRKRPRFPQPH